MWRSIFRLFGDENDINVEPNLEIFGGTESQNKMKTSQKKFLLFFFCLFFFCCAFRKFRIEQRRLHRVIITVHRINTGFLRRLLLLLDDKVVKNPRRCWNCQRNSQHFIVVLTVGSCNDCSQFPSSSALLDVSPHPGLLP